MNLFYQEKNKKNIFLNFCSCEEVSENPQLAAIEANTTDAAQEKHVPVVSVNGNQVEVCVGSVHHPMQDEHFITAIYIETSFGGQVRRLAPNQEPKAVFILAEGESFIAAYEYCNLHGLWKA